MHKGTFFFLEDAGLVSEGELWAPVTCEQLWFLLLPVNGSPRIGLFQVCRLKLDTVQVGFRASIPSLWKRRNHNPLIIFS